MILNPMRKLGLIAALLAAPVLQAQEFTVQTLLVAPLDAASPRIARQVERATRSRLARSANRREVRVVGSDTIENSLRRAGYTNDIKLNDGERRLLARQMRADEIVVGVIESRPGTIEVKAHIALPRDWRLIQPLPVVRGPTPAAVGDSLANQVIRARSQMIGLRRCENALRMDDLSRAIQSAEAAVSSYTASTLARTCLAVALRLSGVNSDSVIRVSEDVLRGDSANIVAAVVRARALASSKPATDAWDYVLRLRPDSLDLALTAVEELLRLQDAVRALDGAGRLAAIHESELRVKRLMFRAYVALSQWKNAAVLGDSLDWQDVAFRTDSTYAIRHIEALRLSGDTLAAISKSARSVKEFPGDLSMYLQYAQLVKGEGPAVFPRGLALFPSSSELHVLAAREAVAAGKRRDALNSLGAAIKSDTALTQGFLQIAQLWLEEQQPDSAVAVIARAPRTGPRAELLRTYAMAQGRQMIGGTPDTAFTVWRRALHLFAIADSVDSRDDTRGLIAATTLQLARGGLVLASKDRQCPPATMANEVLGITATMLERGVGDGTGATELREAYDAMRPIADAAIKRYCPAQSQP